MFVDNAGREWASREAFFDAFASPAQPYAVIEMFAVRYLHRRKDAITAGDIASMNNFFWWLFEGDLDGDPLYRFTLATDAWLVPSHVAYRGPDNEPTRYELSFTDWTEVLSQQDEAETCDDAARRWAKTARRAVREKPDEEIFLEAWHEFLDDKVRDGENPAAYWLEGEAD